MIYSQDFETTTQAEDCRVWAWGSYCLDNDDFIYSNDIEGFIDFVWDKADTKKKIYYHNLKFDGDFIINYLLRNGYTYVKDKKQATDKSFTMLVSGLGQWYSITLFLYKKKGRWVKCEILDSLKLLNFKVSEIATAFDLEERKGSIDYYKPRPVGYEIDTGDELPYLYNDCKIVAEGLKAVFDLGWNKMTQGSNALADYKKRIGVKRFDKFYPQLPLMVDEVIRLSYKGGFTYASPLYAGKDVGKGLVFDVNSLYPSVMRYELLPHGFPIYFDGEYKEDNIYPLYIQAFTCQFELKENHIPTYQDKTGLFKSTEYLVDSRDKFGNLQEVDIVMTNIDMKLFFEHYDVYNIEYRDGYKFKGAYHLFDDYIDYWSKEKIDAKNSGNNPLYLLSKLMLNALYGKFGMNPKVRGKYPVYDEEEDLIKYKTDEEEIRNGLYIPMASFITAYARRKTISTCQSMYEYFAYADTDSAHLVCKEGQSINDLLDICNERFEIDRYKLGAWDHEGSFLKARYLRAKTYMEYITNHKKDKHGLIHYDWKVTCAGMPSDCYKYVTYDNFHFGTDYEGKKATMRVRGGTILNDVVFSLRE